MSYEISPLPKINGGDMDTAYLRGQLRTLAVLEAVLAQKNTFHRYTHAVLSSTTIPIKMITWNFRNSFNAQDPGVVVMSFNVRDSYTDDVRDAYPETATDAKNISKQVLINDEVIWDEDLLGKNEGYEGWVVEEYVEGADTWDIKEPRVKSGWKLVDIPVYLTEGNNELKLRVYANEDVNKLPKTLNVYWDGVAIKSLSQLVMTGDTVRMKWYSGSADYYG